MPEESVPYRNGMDYGVGIDTPSGASRNVAVLGDPTEISNAPGSIVTYSLHQVSSEEDMQSQLGISAEAGGGVGLFSASARLNFSKDCSYHSNAVFALVQVSVQLAFSSIRAPTPNQTAIAIAQEGDSERFQREFGDMFVRGLSRGGVFFGMVSIQTTSKDDQEKLGIAVSGAYGPFSASGSFSSAFHDAIQNRSLDIKVYQEGGAITSQPTSLEQLETIASTWASTVEAKAVAYGALLDSYTILDLPNPPNYIDLENQKEVLARCSVLRNQDWQLLNDIDYVLGHPDEFAAFDAAVLKQAQDNLASDLNVITKAASYALDHPKEAAEPQGLLVTAFSLPERTGKPPAPPVLVQVPDVNAVGMETFQTDDKYAGIRGQLNFHFFQVAAAGHPDDGQVDMTPAAGTMVPPGTTIECAVHVWNDA
jgi:hypothetical protein